jgi:hypothetical protein
VGGDKGERELKFFHPHPNPLPSRERVIYYDLRIKIPKKTPFGQEKTLTPKGYPIS